MTLARPQLILLASMALAALIYWPGLSGPFLFDDVLNLDIVQRWLDGETSWLGAVAGSRDWLEARPVSMASFTLTGWLGTGDSFSYKLGNLVLHLACAWLAWLLLRRVLANDTRLSAHGAVTAAIVVSLWLLHPLHVSTVLYAVQRMAQLSTFFVLASVLMYVVARQWQINGKTVAATLSLFLIFPLLVIAGVFSKQNAVVAPGLCLVLELAYFSRRDPARRRLVTAFFSIFLLLPACGVLGLLLFAPNTVLSGYADWDFTLGQRLMSQARALVDYAGMLLLPRGPRMGLYTDDFATSFGLLSPPTTLLAIIFLTGTTAGAIALRKRAPSIFAGWLFFLVAHTVESSFIPVELYYEHRNYLPSIGLLLAVVATVELLLSRVPTRLLSPTRLATFATLGITLAFVFALFGRVQIWRSMESITEQATIGRPLSLRAAQSKAMLLAGQMRLDEGIAALAPFLDSDLPRNRMLAGLDTVTIKCVRDKSVDPAEVERILIDAQPKITVGEVLVMRQMQTITSKFGCGDLRDDVLADLMVELIAKAHAQTSSSPPNAQMHSLAAVGFARGGRLDDARRHAQVAWEGTHDLVVGDLLARFYLLSGMPAEARAIIDQLQARVRSSDKMGLRQLVVLEAMFKTTSATEQPNSDDVTSSEHPALQ